MLIFLVFGIYEVLLCETNQIQSQSTINETLQYPSNAGKEPINIKISSSTVRQPCTEHSCWNPLEESVGVQDNLRISIMVTCPYLKMEMEMENYERLRRECSVVLH